MHVGRVLLVEPRGFCAGVETAVSALAWLVALEPGPVYCLNEIVHNDDVAARFRRLGVIFVGDLDDVPAGTSLVLSAHGTAPRTAAAATLRAAVLVDAVCPLVTKVHREIAQRVRDGYTVLYAGRSGHDESTGALGVAPGSTLLVEDPVAAAAAADDLDGRPVAFVSQTTLLVEEVAAMEGAIRARRTDVWAPTRSDLCFATTNRQHAVRQVADRADAVVVVGSASSSNTASLERAARDAGCAIEWVIADVVDRLAPRDGVTTVRVSAEDEGFALPRALRRLLDDALAAGNLPAPLAELSSRPAGEVPAALLLDAVERAAVR
ncbi:MAG: 4-hydroxy-3-methylbut-2-enyl diphosphate reductase [Jiangellaceae bacterium]